MGRFVYLVLQKLRKLYGYDLSVVKKTEVFGSEDEELKALALHHLNAQVAAAVNEYFSTVGNDPECITSALVVFQAGSHELTQRLKQIDPKMVKFAEEFGKVWLQNKYGEENE